MERAIWKGNISFGLINVPVVLHSAEQKYELHFRMIDSRNQAKIRYERVNEVTGKQVPWDSIVKGYEYSDGNFVLLDDKDFEKADLKAAHSIQIEDFIDQSSLDPFFFDKPYILSPAKKAEKGYVLLRETLARSKRVGIARVVIRTRQHIAALMPRGPALVLNILRYYQELRDVSKLDLPKGDLKKYHVSPKEIEMAEKFVESMTVKWDPKKYKDEYRESLMKWIKKKAKEGDLAKPPELEPEEAVTVGAGSQTIDIMQLLQKSIQQRPTNEGRRPEVKDIYGREPSRV